MTTEDSSRRPTGTGLATRTTRMTRTVLAGVLALAVLAPACAPDPSDAYVVDAPPATRAEPDVELDDEGASFPANGETVEVRALDNIFRDETIEIEAGTEVLWINGGRNEHNILPVGELDGFGAERDVFLPGDEYRYLFDTVGVVPYYCSIHGTEDVGMIGTVVVIPPAA